MSPLTPTNKTLFVLVSFAMFACTFGIPTVQAQGPMQGQWPYSTDKSPTMSVEMGLRVFERPGDSVRLPIATNSVTNEVLFTSDEASDLETAAGADLRVNFKGKRFGNLWEFRSIIVDFDAAVELEGPNLDLPLLPGFSPDFVDYKYGSQFLSFELNHKRPVLPGLTLLAGPRFISFDEEVSTQFEQRFDEPFGPLDVEGVSTIEAINSLYGAQVGFEYNLPISQNIYISTIGKIGGFANPARVIQTNESNIDPVSTMGERSKNTGAFLAEVNVRAYFEIVPSCVSTYVGYDAMVLDGIAVAPAQFLTVDTLTGLDSTNTPFFHSITMGVQMQY